MEQLFKEIADLEIDLSEVRSDVNNDRALCNILRTVGNFTDTRKQKTYLMLFVIEYGKLKEYNPKASKEDLLNSAALLSLTCGMTETDKTQARKMINLKIPQH